MVKAVCAEFLKMLQLIDITTIDSIVATLHSRVALNRVILFGSYADGTATPESDLDLVVVVDSKLSPKKRYLAVCRALSDFVLPLDLIVKSREEYEFEKDCFNHIVYFAARDGHVIYAT